MILMIVWAIVAEKPTPRYRVQDRDWQSELLLGFWRGRSYTPTTTPQANSCPAPLMPIAFFTSAGADA